MKNVFIKQTLLYDFEDVPKCIFGSGFFTTESIPRFEDELDVNLDDFLTYLKDKEIQSITLPISDTINYLEFSGFLLGHHIRLTEGLRFREVPLIYYGSLDVEILLRLTPLGQILITPNVYYYDLKKEGFHGLEAFVKQVLAVPKLYSLKKYLDRVHIPPPVHHLSHHSLENELALMRWSEYIGCHTSLPAELKQRTQKGLYFKYFNSQSAISIKELSNSEKTLENPSIKASGKVLLIDDEASKGWYEFYKNLFKKYGKGSQIELEFLEIDYSNTSVAIVEAADEKVKAFLPDVVLLDLRLCDEDFKQNVLPNELTGARILQNIKAFNQGIQVIITTASDKIWNYQFTQNLRSNGYILKKSTPNVPEELSNLAHTIHHALEAAPPLKENYSLIQSLKAIIQSNSFMQADEILNKFFTNYEIAFELLEKAFEKRKENAMQETHKYMGYAFLQLFLCIEEFVGIDKIFKYGDICYVYDGRIIVAEHENKTVWKVAIKHKKNKPAYHVYDENERRHKHEGLGIQTDFKVASVIIFLLDQPDSSYMDWPKIRDLRNRAVAHANSKMVDFIKTDDIMRILKFQTELFDEKKWNPRKEGLQR